MTTTNDKAIETTLTLRAGKCIYDGAPGFVVSVADGPQDLLWRGTREMALADGAARVAAHWVKVNGEWRAI